MTLLKAILLFLIILTLAVDDAIKTRQLRHQPTTTAIRSTAIGGGKNNWSVTCYADGGLKVE